MISKDVVEAAVRRQLAAMGADRYVLSVGAKGKMINAQVDAAGVMKRLDWLRHENAAGKNIYIKPVGDHDLVLIDDIEYEAIERLIADGLRPAAVAETSPNNFQSWVRVGVTLDPDMRRSVARVLARDYSGDLGAASQSQPGRLAGFTNRKDKHLNAWTGKYPWVKLEHWSGFIIAAGARDDLLRKSESEMSEDGDVARVAIGDLPPLRIDPGPPTAAQIKRPARIAYEGAMRKALNDARRAGEDPDLHRCDWKVVQELAKKGYSTAEVMDAMLSESPDLLARKGGDTAAQGYVRRTLSKIRFANPFSTGSRCDNTDSSTTPTANANRRGPAQE